MLDSNHKDKVMVTSECGPHWRRATKKWLIMAMLATVIPAFSVNSALAQDFQYAGPSNVAGGLDGGQGIFAYHDACAKAFKKATWCTTQMIVEGGPAKNAPLPDGLGEWVIPVIVAEVGNSLRDFSGIGASPQVDINCRSWTTDGDFADRSGFVVRTTGNQEVNFGTKECNTARQAACCVPKRGR